MASFVDDLHQATERLDRAITETRSSLENLIKVIEEHMILSRKSVPPQVMEGLKKDMKL